MQTNDFTAPTEIASAALRAACLNEARESEHFELSLLWQQLSSGSWRVTDQFSSPERHYVVVETSLGSTRDQPRPAARHFAALRQVLSGSYQKTLALDLGLSPATVASNLAIALTAMGLDTRASRVPVILAMAAHAAREPGSNFGARCTALGAGDKLLRVISVDRPDLHLRHRLTAAEFVVVQLFLDAHTHGDIAAIRGSRLRTIANQLASAYDRLGLSGRSELIGYVVRTAATKDGASRSDSASHESRLTT